MNDDVDVFKEIETKVAKVRAQLAQRGCHNPKIIIYMTTKFYYNTCLNHPDYSKYINQSGIRNFMGVQLNLIDENPKLFEINRNYEIAIVELTH